VVGCFASAEAFFGYALFTSHSKGNATVGWPAHKLRCFGVLHSICGSISVYAIGVQLLCLLAVQVIKVSVLTTADDLPQQPAAQQPPQPLQQQHVKAAAALKSRPLVHRLPDAAAAARFKSCEPPEDAAAAAADGDDESMDIDAAQQQQQQLAPRIVADPGQVAQQLAGWVRVAAAGEAGEADGGLAGEAAGFDEEGLLGPGGAEPEDMLDEEEWV
jgi:hypothetical protein